MSHVRIWVHIVFATKNREHLLKDHFRYDVFKHIADNCLAKNIFLQAINGYTDHISLPDIVRKRPKYCQNSSAFKRRIFFLDKSTKFHPEYLFLAR